jgi:hypothetical protein
MKKKGIEEKPHKKKHWVSYGFTRVMGLPGFAGLLHRSVF